MKEASNMMSRTLVFSQTLVFNCCGADYVCPNGAHEPTLQVR